MEWIPALARMTSDGPIQPPHCVRGSYRHQFYPGADQRAQGQAGPREASRRQRCNAFALPAGGLAEHRLVERGMVKENRLDGSICVCMRTPGSPRELERQRLQAIALLEAGHRPSQVARRLGVSPAAVSRWKAIHRRVGLEGLKAKPHPGPHPRLTARQRHKLGQLLLKGPLAHGYTTDLWTLKRMAEVIEKHFGVHYDPSGVWHVLHRIGWGGGKPSCQGRQCDAEAPTRCPQQDRPRSKKRPGKQP